MYTGYVFKFNLHARHSILIENKLGTPHSHTWLLSVYLKAQDVFSEFNDTEEIIQNALAKYENIYFNDLPAFESTTPTLENLGDFLYEIIDAALIAHGVKIYKLEISETPTRVYIVRRRAHSKLKFASERSRLAVKSILSYATDSLSSSFSAKNRPVPAQPKPIPAKGEKLEQENTNYFISEPKPVIQAITPHQNKNRLILKALGGSLFLILCTMALLLYINQRGNNPWGSDGYGHIFKSDLLYKAIKEGNFYPIYTNLWYNGIQPFRYWAPLPYHILAAFQFIGGGDPIVAYNIFVAFCFLFGAFGWLLWGMKENRVFLSTVIAVVWFCMPDNVRVFFSEANIPRMAISFLIPYMLFFIWQFVRYEKKYALVMVILLMTCISMCHLMIAAMLGISSFLFLLYYGLINHSMGRPIQTIIGMLFGIALCGVWLFPALHGGLMSLNQEAVSEVMKALTFPAVQSLNPMLRTINIEIYYFGISFMFAAIIGLFFSNKQSLPGFLTLVTVFIGTTTALVPFLIKLPLSQLLWMMRFTPIAYGFFALSMLMWKNIRRYVMIILMTLIIIDSAVSFRLLAFNTMPPPDTVNMLNEAVEMTNQRIAIMDISEFGSFPSYYICADKHHTQYAYGWAWQGATTAANIVLLNTALEKEYYFYMFDRCFELGCDTVLVKKNHIRDLDKLLYDASRSNYVLMKEYNNGYLFKTKTPAVFGMTVKYFGLAVGSSATNIVFDFPGFQIGNEDALDSYTLEDLLDYEVIYLSGFTYRHKETAEKLVRDAAEAGVQFVVDMNRVPNDPITNRLTFLNVTAQPIQFENKLPDLHFSDVVYFPLTFKEEFRKWNTVYLENVPNPRGFSWFAGNRLTFIGEDTNPNITFIGFNLLYHGIANEDHRMADIFATVMGRMQDELPERRMVPTNIKISANTITIDAQEGNINTTLAFLDAFESDQPLYKKHNLLYIEQPHTTIRITYPYVKQGIYVSIAAFLGSLLFLYFTFRKRGKNYEKRTVNTNKKGGL